MSSLQLGTHFLSIGTADVLEMVESKVPYIREKEGLLARLTRLEKVVDAVDDRQRTALQTILVIQEHYQQIVKTLAEVQTELRHIRDRLGKDDELPGGRVEIPKIVWSIIKWR